MKKRNHAELIQHSDSQRQLRVTLHKEMRKTQTSYKKTRHKNRGAVLTSVKTVLTKDVITINTCI